MNFGYLGNRVLKNLVMQTVVRLDGRPVGRFAVWSPREEVHIKSMRPGADVHLSVFVQEGQLSRHVTHERYALGDGRRHRQHGQVSIQELVSRFFGVLCPPGEAPPAIHDLRDPREIERLAPRFGAMLLSSLRPIDDTPVMLPGEPWGTLLDASVTPNPLRGVNLEIDYSTQDAAQRKDGDSVDETFTASTLAQMAANGRRVAFSSDEQFVFVIGDGFAFRLWWERVLEMQMWLDQVLGVEGYVRTLRRKGFLASYDDLRA